MAAGELTPDEAGTVATFIEAHRKAIERVIGFDDRTAELETLLPGDSVAIQGSL